MWATMKANTTDKSQMFMVDAKARLRNMWCTELGDIKAHLVAMVSAQNELFGLSITVPDDDFAIMIMGSLPPLYHQLLSNVSAAAKMASTKVKPNDLIKFINEVDFRARDIAGGPGESALYASNTSSKPGKARGKPADGKSTKKGKCHNCKREGHYESDCWRPGGGKEGQGLKQLAKKAEAAKESASVAAENINFAFTCSSDYAELAESLSLAGLRSG